MGKFISTIGTQLGKRNFEVLEMDISEYSVNLVWQILFFFSTIIVAFEAYELQVKNGNPTTMFLVLFAITTC